MGAYFPLFTLSVEHDFFPGSVCSRLDFAPAPASAALLNKTGLLTKPSANGFGLYYDADQAETLDLYAGEPAEPFVFRYRVFSKDLYFKIYTEAGADEESALLYFDNAKAQGEGTKRFRLHAGATATADDLLPLDAPLLNDLITKKDRLIRPAFMVHIDMSNAADRGKRYVVKFKARETLWKYYLMGNPARENAYITDLASQNQFEFTGPESVLDDKVALCFRSKYPIPLREKQECRFQLRERGPGNGKVLIKRLPVAAAKQISTETINGKKAVISEIYVNC